MFQREFSMCSSPLLSVIVPVYNAESYLSKCLDSLLAQDFSDYEIILVDDGSTDSSGAICDQYTSKNPICHCIHRTNGGHVSARKSGLEISRGQYVTFVDNDDWIAPDMYRKMCQAVYDTHADIVVCDYIAAMPDRETVVRTLFAPGYYDKTRLEKEVYPSMIYSGSFFHYGIGPTYWNKIFRRDLFQDHLFRVPNDIIIGDDALATYSCMLKASSIYYIDEPFYYYRSTAGSVSRRAEVPAKRLVENHKVFDTLRNVIDTSKYPCMEKQLDYYFVYQSLLTYELVFKNMTRMSLDFKQSFEDECNDPLIRKAFASVPIKDITGTHNKLYAFCIRHHLYRLFRLLLKH